MEVVGWFSPLLGVSLSGSACVEGMNPYVSCDESSSDLMLTLSGSKSNWKIKTYSVKICMIWKL